MPSQIIFNFIIGNHVAIVVTGEEVVGADEALDSLGPNRGRGAKAGFSWAHWNMWKASEDSGLHCLTEMKNMQNLQVNRRCGVTSQLFLVS